MYIVKAKSKKGGFWNAKDKKLVRELETGDKALAADYKSKGYEVVEKKKVSSDDKNSDK